VNPGDQERARRAGAKLVQAAPASAWLGGYLRAVRRAAVVAMVVLAACASGPRPTSFPEQMALESGDLPVRTIRSPDGSFSTKILGRLDSSLSLMGEEADVSALIDIGSATPVECTFFRGDLDLASAMIEFSDRGFEKVARHLGRVLEKQTQQISAGAIGSSPTLSLAWRYRVDGGIGLIKHRIASVDGRGLYCRHVETGYAKTFSRLFTTMVRYLEREDGLPEAFYTVVSRTKLRGQPRGVEKHVAREVGDGSTRIESRSSMLVASHYGRLSAIDTVFIRFARPNGALINAVYARSENGALVTNLSLDPRNGVWALTGTRNGVPYDQEIHGQTQPTSILGEVHALREVLRDQGPDGTVELRGWYPHIDPLRLMKRVTVVGPRRDVDHFHAISKVGPVVVESVIDAAGETKWSRWLDASIGELETDLVFVDGGI
jgi:hypothetical protein